MDCIDRVCRLCLAEAPAINSDAMVLLNDNIETLNIIRTVASVEVIVDVGCHYFMCAECNKSLQNFYAFRERCIVNDDIFRRKFCTSGSKSGVAVFLPVDIFEPYKISPKEEKNRSESEQSDGEENSVERCMIDTVKEGNDGDEPLYESLEVVHNDSTDSGTSSKTKKKVIKNRGTKKKPKSEETNNKLPCSACGKMIARNNINQHLLTHDPDRPKVFCSYCGKAFKDPRRMQLHINSNHTLEKKYPCDICGKVYLRPTSLKDHKAAKHTTDKRYECNECGTAFNSWAQRWHHFKKEHTTAKPYACTYCDWAFKFKGDLTLHIRKHTGEKPFKCDICGKAFNKSYNVVIHKKSHRNILPGEGVVQSETVEIKIKSNVLEEEDLVELGKI